MTVIIKFTNNKKKKLKHFSIKELNENKDKYGIRFYDYYTIYAGYKVFNLNDIHEPIGYITFNQMQKLKLKRVRNFLTSELYIIEE